MARAWLRVRGHAIAILTVVTSITIITIIAHIALLMTNITEDTAILINAINFV